jgi:hypothetical protein
MNTNNVFENFFNSKPNIYISLTTSPTRIDKIEHLLKSLSEQTIKPYKIVLNLPHVFKRTNQTFDKIPEFINKYPLVQINRVDDIGPITKIIGSLNVVENPEDIIISVDDDIKYNENMIEILTEIGTIFPNAAVTGTTFILDENIDGIQYVKLVEGYGGVLYRKKFFDNFNVDELNKMDKVCFFADDLIISNHLSKNKIKMILADKSNKYLKDVYLDYGSGNDALKNGADNVMTIPAEEVGKHGSVNTFNYIKCTAYLKQNNDYYITTDYFG